MKIKGKSINNISRTPKIVILVVIGVFVTGLLIGGSIEQTTAAKKMNIPGWVKNNAEWWAQGQISDEDFATGIEYMINDGIIKVQQVQAQTPTSSGQPFDELWDAIIKLQNDLANIQVSNGDQGPAGPPGAQGPQGRIIQERKLVNVPPSGGFSSVPARITCTQGTAISGSAQVQTVSISEDPATFFETWVINGGIISGDTYYVVSDRTRSSNGYQLELQVICLVQTP